MTIPRLTKETPVLSSEGLIERINIVPHVVRAELVNYIVDCCNNEISERAATGSKQGGVLGAPRLPADREKNNEKTRRATQRVAQFDSKAPHCPLCWTREIKNGPRRCALLCARYIDAATAERRAASRPAQSTVSFQGVCTRLFSAHTTPCTVRFVYLA